jgi:hypothetical protein
MGVMKREASLKSAFFKELAHQCPNFYTLRHHTRAAPDRSITGGGRTTFWEFKHGTPHYESPGDQELMCMRLAIAGYCRYVLWWETAKGVGQRTMIIHPRQMHDRVGSFPLAEAWCSGYNHRWLVHYIRGIHEIHQG